MTNPTGNGAAMEILFETIWPRFGLILNFAGTVMIALSIGKNLGGAYQTDGKGPPRYLAAVLHPRLFKLGMIVLILGFVMQIIL